VNVIELIERKKRGGALSEDEIAWLVAGFTAGRVPEYQMAACLMAIWFRGLDPAETVALTGAMLHSGAELDLSGLPGPTADKHSTGGVGDKVSLLLAPLAAACGLYVPMLSGRGLGHTGGTLDKLAAVPGYRTDLDTTAFLRVVGETGCAIIGQGPAIAPADGRIYALRDVTGTVDCVPLITASILSKKLAAGPASIVIDLKTGSGAFMTDLAAARALARALIDVAAHWGRRVAVVFSDMSQPLGVAVGHAVEALEAFAALRPGGRAAAPADLVALTEDLVAEMLLLSGLARERAAALVRVREAWDGGAAHARLLAWLAAQGGRVQPQREDNGLDIAPVALAVTAPADGWVSGVACREVGYALSDLGGGRRRVEDQLDLAAGIMFHARLGARVAKGEPLATLLCRDRARAEVAAQRLRAAITLADAPVAPPALVMERLGSPVA
jgi:pyrimidine-nucleoside phosphorylase